MASENTEKIDENVPNKSETISILTENVKGKEGKGKRKWSNQEMEKLIEEYEKNPCLWDVFTEDYHNIEKTSMKNPFSSFSTFPMLKRFVFIK